MSAIPEQWIGGPLVHVMWAGYPIKELEYTQIENVYFIKNRQARDTKLDIKQERKYNNSVDVDKKLKDAFNALDFLSDEAKAFIARVARDDAGGNFNIDNFVSGDRRAEWRQAEAERIRGIRSRMSPEKAAEERAKAAERMRALRQSRRASP